MPFRGHDRPTPGRTAKNPPAATSQEAAYLKSLGDKRKAVSLKLTDGEVVQGWIEYYDRDMLRLTRENQPNLFIFKHDILYIAEEAEKRPKR
jgi:host factor-I protein